MSVTIKPFPPNRYDRLWRTQGWLKCSRCGVVERPHSDRGLYHEGQHCSKPTVRNGQVHRKEHCNGTYISFENSQTAGEVYSTVFIRILLARITDPTWQATFVIPDGIQSNRCFHENYVRQCVQSEDRAYDLFVTDFMHLAPDWQRNLTDRTYGQWCQYDRERRGSERKPPTKRLNPLDDNESPGIPGFGDSPR